MSDRSVDVRGEHGKIRFRDLAVLCAEACSVYDMYGESGTRFERAAAVLDRALDDFRFMLPAIRQVGPQPGSTTRKKLAEVKGRKLSEIVHTYVKQYVSDRPHQGDGLDDSAAAGAGAGTAATACDENGSYLESNILSNIFGTLFIFLAIINHALRNNYSMYLTQYKDRCLYKL